MAGRAERGAEDSERAEGSGQSADSSGRGGHALDEGGGGVAGGEGLNVDAGPHFIQGGFFPRIKAVRGVVASFGVNVGAEQADFLDEPGIREDKGGVDKTQTGQGVGAVFGTIQGAVRAFQGADGGVTVDGDNEEIAQLRGVFEVVKMPPVQQVEAAVGQDDGAALGTGGFPKGEDFFEGGSVGGGQGGGGRVGIISY